MNLEFPKYSEDESFQVFLNDIPVDFIQSNDEMGNWHVAFFVEPKSEGTLSITGFDPNGEPIIPELIPKWLRTDANLWSNDKISDLEFLEGINFLFERQVIFVQSKDVVVQSQWKIPLWVKISADWWYDGKISDDEFLKIIENLVQRKIIVI